jgi:hypothetical protein
LATSSARFLLRRFTDARFDVRLVAVAQLKAAAKEDDQLMIAHAQRPHRSPSAPRCSFSSPDEPVEPPPDEPSDMESEPDEPSDPGDLEFEDLPCTDDDDSQWEAFIPDDDERDPEPAPGDFWIE